ncbi:hydrolase [Mycena sp. CBHHK59/15]|nr:hydrolase [Mycena sp. CBHHK59/15]
MFNLLAIFLSLLLAHPGQPCPHASPNAPGYEELLNVARSNNLRRDQRLRNRNAPATAITNVRVFDGQKLLPLGTVYIEGGIIVLKAEGATVVDGNGGVLLSGLIDAHTHPISVDHLATFASYGVTTAILGSCYPPDICASLTNQTGLTDVRFPGLSANSPDSTHALMGNLPANVTLTSPSQAPQFVADQVEIGATFIKIIAEHANSATTLDQATMDALVVSAHSKDLRIVCHAADYAAVDRALTARVDQSHHVPLDLPLDSTLITRFLAQGTISVPTLAIVDALVSTGSPLGPPSYSAANASVAVLHNARVPILAGTDSNVVGAGALALAFGTSLHHELELLVEAGLSTVDALRSATVLAVQHNLLFDRGVIAPGMRADLLLIGGDPIANISATRNIQRVWVAGIEYADIVS